MRVYVPMLLGELAAVPAPGRLPERAPFAVTDAVRALDPTADEEDLEFEAMCQALDAARDLGLPADADKLADLVRQIGRNPRDVGALAAALRTSARRNHRSAHRGGQFHLDGRTRR